MDEERDYALDGKDRAEWDLAWASMPHRRLLSSPQLVIEGIQVQSATISADPPQFSDKVCRQFEICLLCGATTAETERLPATLHPNFANGLSYGLGVWVHRSCFEDCPDAGSPAPIPW